MRCVNIRAKQPDILVIELCKARTNLLQLDEETILEEAQSLNLDKSLEIIRSQGTVQGVMYLLLLSMSAHLTKELGMAPEGEFRPAYQETQKLSGCIIKLGVRPIQHHPQEGHRLPGALAEAEAGVEHSE